MKVARDTGYEVTGTFEGEKIDMSIAQSAMAHIMNVLTDLYSNRIYAVLREYATNAWDAHVEAGVNAPIRVTLPSTLAPFLKIADSGVGLTVEDIHSIYSQYGESTKRGTNAQNGMLGLGCKSALTYTQQFTVVSIKDGTKISVVVGRDEDGSGSMTVVDTVRTDEPNGTEIVVPVERGDVADFIEEAGRFFCFWPEGQVVVNGKPPARFEGLRLADDLFITDYDQSYIVMGNVPYPAPELSSLCRGEVLAFVPIGAVNFPPSREALMDTKATRTTIESVKDRFAKQVQGAIQREIDACPNPADAIRTIIRWEQKITRNAHSVGTYTYQSRPMPEKFVQHGPVLDFTGQPKIDATTGQHTIGEVPILTTRNAAAYYGLGQTNTRPSIPVTDWPGIVWVEGFKVKHTAQIKRKLQKWVNDNGLEGVETFVLLEGAAPTSEFIERSRVVTYDTIKKIVLDPKPRNGWSGPARIPGSFNVYRHGAAIPAGINPGRDEFTDGVPGADLDQKHPILWISGNRWAGRSYYQALVNILPAFTLVCLPENRVAKFCREVTAAQTPREAAQAEFDKWVKTVTDQQRLAIHMDDRDLKRCLSRIDPVKVDDPDLRAAAITAKIDVSKLLKAREGYKRLIAASMPNVTFTNPLSKYPLFRSDDLRGKGESHVYLYLNAAYAVI